MVTVRIALRNIARQKKRSILLAGAIAFGMLVITVLNSFTAGMVENVRVNFSHALGGHIFISGKQLNDDGEVINQIHDEQQLSDLLLTYSDEIEGVTKRTQTIGTFIFGSKQGMQLIYGVDFQEETKLLDSLTVISGDLTKLDQENAIVIPAPLGQRLGIEAGEIILVKMETISGQQNVGEFIVAALIEDQASFGISAAYADKGYLNYLLGLMSDGYQLVNVFLKDVDRLDQVADKFSHVLIGEPKGLEEQSAIFGIQFEAVEELAQPWEGVKYSILTLNDIMEPVEAVVTVIDAISLGIFLVLLLIIMVGITNTFRMVLIERVKEIGTMRAFGMQQNTVKAIFLLEALFLGLFGGLAGLVGASLVMVVLSFVSFSHVTGLQFFLNNGYLTFQVSVGTVCLTFAILAVMSLLAAYLPARAAARLSPIKALGSYH